VRASRRVALRLRLARYWHARGDVDEAARQAQRALGLVRAGRAVPLPMVPEVVLVMDRLERERDNHQAGHHILTWGVELLGSAPAAAGRDALLGELLTAQANSHRRAGRYPEATSALCRARDLLEECPAATPGQHAELFTTLGIVAKELGAHDAAAAWYAQVGRILTGSSAPTAALAALQHNLAGLAHAQRDYEKAEKHALRAVRLHRQAPGTTSVDIALDIAVLAAVVAGQGRYEEARTLLAQAMAACGRVRPPCRYELAVHLHSLADVEQASGNHQAAEQRYRQALALKEELLGPDHPEVGLVSNNLGTLLSELGRTSEALECYRRALRITERHFPPGHPHVVTVRRHLGRAEAPSPRVGEDQEHAI
jgi:tetratricopeptide (TPR) repeat protein